MADEQDMLFQSERGCALDFFKVFNMILKLQLFNYCFFYFSLSSSFIDFEIAHL
jgi:hypothetical protein